MLAVFHPSDVRFKLEGWKLITGPLGKVGNILALRDTGPRKEV
jgi:hypothetical protein